MGPITEADQISDIAFGFMGSKALFVALDHEIFTHLSKNALDADEIAGKTGLHRDRAETLLTGLAGLGLLTVKDGRFANAPGAEAFLVRGAKYDFGEYLRLQVGQQMYALIHQLGAAIAGRMPANATASYEDWFEDAEEARLYSESQHAGALRHARQVTKKVDLSDAKTLLDVGGGTGAFAIALCEAFPDLTATVVDFPNVATVGRDYAEAAGLADRIAFIDGNALKTDWPAGQDIVMMSYLLSGVPGREHETLVGRAFETLAPGGRLLVHDYVVEADRSGPRLAALWQLQHTAFTPEARSVDVAGLEAMLRASGFAEVETVEMIPQMTKLSVGRRPG